MTEQEKLKYVLLENVGFDLAKAKGCYDFIAGESGTAKGNGEKANWPTVFISFMQTGNRFCLKVKNAESPAAASASA